MDEGQLDQGGLEIISVHSYSIYMASRSVREIQVDITI